MKFKNFGIKKLEIPKNDNLKIVLPEDLLNMTNGHDLLQGLCPETQIFFPTLSASMFSKKPTVKICMHQLPVSTYLPTNQQIF
jgi:hypothetical protein